MSIFHENNQDSFGSTRLCLTSGGMVLVAMVALGVSLGQVLSMGFSASLRGLTNGGSDHGQDHGDDGENKREFHFL